MTTYDFDTVIDRRGTNCVKYDIFDDPDLISMWVADMDFRSPQSVIDALQSRLEHPIFGYTMDSPPLREVLVERMARLYNWTIQADEIIFIPGVVAALNAAMRATGKPGDKVLTHTPVYPPFLASPEKNHMVLVTQDFIRHEENGRLHYTIDFDAFEAAAADPDTHIYLLCSPHNPVGRVWTPDELRQMAAICERHNVVICSDEIHGDLIFQSHTPTAALAPEISQNTVTLMAPSKTYNIPSLGFSFAIIQNAELREKFHAAEGFVVPHVGVLGYTAALGAYTGGDEWLAAALDYMRDNRDLVTDFITTNLPELKVTHPEGTYLSWIDCTALPDIEADMGENPFLQWVEPFFLTKANVALNNGGLFGDVGKGYARLNFALPRAQLQQALERMQQAVAAVREGA